MVYNAKAQAAYDKKCTIIKAKLFPNTDRDIIDFVGQSSEPTGTMIKRLICEEMKRKAAENKIE